MSEEEKGLELEKKAEIKEATPKKKKEKKKFKDKWKSYSKGKKALIIIGIIFVIAIIAVVICFALKKDVPVENKVEEVTLENQNYRYQNGTLYFYDKDKNEIGTYECTNKDEEKCYLAYYTNDLDIDNTKYVYENEESVSFQTPIVSNKYVFVYDNKEEKDAVIKLYDFKEQKEDSFYQEVKKAGDDYTFIVKDSSSSYGVLSLKDGIKTLIDFNYNYLGYYDAIKDTYFIASNNDKYFIINSEDKTISKTFMNRITGFSKEFVKVKTGSKYEVYNYNGNRIINNSYDFVTFADKYIIAVKGDNLYILDGSGNNLNIEGLLLNNKYYNRTYIYDSNNKLIKIMNSFEVSVKGNDINIDVYNDQDKETHTINALEAIVNSKSEYVSYIDGKLYFYSDFEKKNQIGSYACKNKNEIANEESELASCYLAKQVDNVYLPIINNRYVFINDTLDNTKQSISLYDLKDNKVLSNYLEVDASYHDDSRFITTEAFYVIAKSAKKDKYGMIMVGTNSVKSVFDFSNNSITALEEYYCVNKSSGTFQVFDKTGTSLTSEFANEIISYDANLKLVMTSEDGKNKLYTANGKSLTTKGYDRIDAYQNYIVAIDSKKLDVINYDGKIVAEGIDLYTTDYNNAYSIDNLKISVYNGTTIVNEVYFNGED